jgi:hypothetical protein
MPPRWSKPLALHYCWLKNMRTDENKARNCNCSVPTYKTRLNEAHERFRQEWYGVRETFHDRDRLLSFSIAPILCGTLDVVPGE